MPALFGSPDALLRYALAPSAPPAHEVPLRDVAVYDQGAQPTCTAAAAVTLLAASMAVLGQRLPEAAVAYNFLVAEQLVTQRQATSIEGQLLGGVPLAASVEGLCLFGVVGRSAVPHPDDPRALGDWLRARGTLETLRDAHGYLPTDLRPLRLFPGVESVKGALFSQKAVAFAFRVGAVVDQWMRRGKLQRGTRFVLPPDAGDRLATHAAVVVGYDDGRAAFRVRNSFGQAWGEGGDFWVPYGTFARSSFNGGELYALG